MLTVHASRPTFVTNFVAAGPASASNVAELAVVGQVMRGEIRQLACVGEHLLVLAGRGVLLMDPRSMVVEARLLGDRVVDHVVVCGARVLVALGSELRELELEGAGSLGPVVCSLPDKLEALVGCETHVGWPSHDGMTLVELDGGGRAELRADPKLLGDGVWRKTPSAVALSPAGTWAAAFKRGDRALTVWRRATGEIVHQSEDEANAVVLFEDGRMLVSRGNDMHVLLSHGSNKPLGKVWLEGQVVSTGVGAVICDRFGAHARLTLAPLALAERVEGEAQHTGSMSQWCAAAGPSCVAVYAGSYGTLHVTTDAHRVSGSWLAKPESLSLAVSGRRLVIETKWRHESMFVDIDAGIERPFVGREGMSGPGISADGATLLVPVGNNLGPRTVCSASVDVDGDARELFKICPWAHRTEPLAPDLFMIATYKLQGAGWVGLYREASSRAVLKLTHAKDKPWRFGLNRDATRCWVDWAGAFTIHDLSARGKQLTRFEGRLAALAMGSADRRAEVRAGEQPRLTLHHGGEPIVVALERVSGGGNWALCYGADDSLVFVGRPDGVIEVHAGDDGQLLRSLALHVGGFVDLQRRAGLIYSLGSDGVLSLLGVPGAAPLVEQRPTLEVEVPELVLLPTTKALAAPGVPELFDLGGRRLFASIGPDGAVLTDAAGERVGSLRKRKGDDPEALAAAKRRWTVLRRRGKTSIDLDAAWLELLEHMLITGQSATIAELAAAWATEAGARNLERTTWIELDSGAVLRWSEGRLVGEHGPLADDARARLAHPARNGAAKLSGMQAERATWTPSSATATSVDPVSTDWAKTQNATVGRILVARGFAKVEDSGHATCGWHLLAPELGGVAVVALDEEHGCATLSFHRWNGTVDGGERQALRDVDPQLYAEAVQAVVDAYPHD